MKMQTSDWIERERRVIAFYGGKTGQSERLLIWRLSRHWAPFLQDYPEVVMMPPTKQLEHFEQRFIHAVAEIDATGSSEITIADLKEAEAKIPQNTENDRWLFVA